MLILGILVRPAVSKSGSELETIVVRRGRCGRKQDGVSLGVQLISCFLPGRLLGLPIPVRSRRSKSWLSPVLYRVLSALLSTTSDRRSVDLQVLFIASRTDTSAKTESLPLVFFKKLC